MRNASAKGGVEIGSRVPLAPGSCKTQLTHTRRPTSTQSAATPTHQAGLQQVLHQVLIVGRHEVSKQRRSPPLPTLLTTIIAPPFLRLSHLFAPPAAQGRVIQGIDPALLPAPARLRVLPSPCSRTTAIGRRMQTMGMASACLGLSVPRIGVPKATNGLVSPIHTHPAAGDALLSAAATAAAAAAAALQCKVVRQGCHAGHVGRAELHGHWPNAHIHTHTHRPA
eukprot:1154520-Pelagomonas_calceolata.AAC.4